MLKLPRRMLFAVIALVAAITPSIAQTLSQPRTTSKDLEIVVWSSLLCIALTVPYMFGALTQLKLADIAGSREGFPTLSGWVGRAQRAHINMIENLAPFIGVVVAVHLASKTSSLELIGAQMFFWARVAHAVLYIANIPIRTFAWLVGVVGTILAALPLIYF